MTIAQRLAEFASQASLEDLSEKGIRQIKLLVLDTIGCAIGSLGAAPMNHLRAHGDNFGGAPLCTLIGGGRTAPDRAAFYNAALVRYLDFNDSYSGAKATCHPSDNMGPVLAAAEYADASGRELITALALAYEVQCRFCDVAPTEKAGFDQTLAGSYAVAAGASRALGLDPAATAHAIAISAVSQNPLFVTRTGQISHWKGFAFANAAFNGVNATFMAMRGITGPLEIFEGPHGLFESITGPFEIDWANESLEKVLKINVKRYNAAVHSQSAIEGIIELREACVFTPDQIDRVDLETYERAYFAMGGGKAGGKHEVRNKETADHSLPYVLAVALLDGEVMPAQYELERILAHDVQDLLRRVHISDSEELTSRFPAESPAMIRITLKDGTVYEKEKTAWHGFFTHPASWETVVQKFEALSEPIVEPSLQKEIVDAVSRLESVQAVDLARMLGEVRGPARGSK
jgi:2-methylcitrate dehydratase